MRHVSTLRAAVPLAIILGAGCGSPSAAPAPFPALPVHRESGPAVEGERRPFTRGDAARGREVVGYRMPPFAPLANSPGVYDDKLVVQDASDRSARRGIPPVFLVDLARKPFFLHDASVPTMEALFDPRRGSQEPHPFYVEDSAARADLITFLKGLGGPGVKPPPK